MAACIVDGAQFFCGFKDILQSLKQTITTVLNCEYESMDISKLVEFSLEINAELECSGKTIVKLAQELEGKLHKQVDDDGKPQDVNTTAKVPQQQKLNHSIDEQYTKTVDESVILDIQGKLFKKRQRNSRLESELEQMRFIYEERLTSMEERVRQVEVEMSKKGKGKIFERRDEVRKNLLRKDCDKRSVENSGRPLQSIKDERQLQEEIKWSRITPVSFRGAKSKTRQQQSFEVVQRKMSHKNKSAV